MRVDILFPPQVLGAFERVPSDAESEGGNAISRAPSFRGAAGKVMMVNSFVRVGSNGSASASRGKDLLKLDDDSNSGPCCVHLCLSVSVRIWADCVFSVVFEASTNTANHLRV